MKCRFGHDQCQSTRMFYLAGQNLALTGASENEYNIAQTRPDTWFSEYVNADMAEIRSHSSLVGANGYESMLYFRYFLYNFDTNKN